MDIKKGGVDGAELLELSVAVRVFDVPDGVAVGGVEGRLVGPSC